MLRKGTVYVIGAGFSAALGFPLTNDLLVRLWPRLDSALKRRLTRVIEFHYPGFSVKRETTFPNIELLLTDLLANEDLFSASRTSPGKFKLEDLVHIRRDLLLAMGEWFHEIQMKANVESISALLQLKRVLGKSDTVISFNWDLVLDQVLFGEELSAKSYGFSGDAGRFSKLSAPVLLKPHGSLNWYLENEGSHLKSEKRFEISNGNDQLVYGFKPFRRPVSKVSRPYMPLIVPPVFNKRFDSFALRGTLRNCVHVLSVAKKIVFLGYSMPEADLHARFIFRCGFHNQVDGLLLANQERAAPAGRSQVVVVNPDVSAARRIESVAGAAVTWMPQLAFDWLLSDGK